MKPKTMEELEKREDEILEELKLRTNRTTMTLIQELIHIELGKLALGISRNL